MIVNSEKARHAEQIKCLNEEWQMKFDDVVEKTTLEIKIEKEKYDQKTEKFRVEQDRSNSERLAILYQEMKDKLKEERDKEIERAVDRIGGPLYTTAAIALSIVPFFVKNRFSKVTVLSYQRFRFMSKKSKK